MDANGVLGSMCFPSFPNLCGQLFSRSSDLEAGLAILQAYNDWHVDEWCGSYPGRFIPLMLPPIWDPEAMAAEVRRVRGQGLPRGRRSRRTPSKLKLPSFHDDHWDPFWQACSDEGTIVCLHIGSSSTLVDHRAGRADRRAHHAAAGQHRPGRGRPAVVAGAAQVPGPARSRCPRAASGGSRTSASGSTGSTPATTRGPGQDFGGQLPSEMFLERIVLCFIDDPAGVEQPRPHGRRHGLLGERLPALRLHLADVARDAVAVAIGGVPDDEIDRITHANAMRHFRFDPFAAPAAGGVHGGRAAGAGHGRGRDAAVGRAAGSRRRPGAADLLGSHPGTTGMTDDPRPDGAP